MADDLLSPASSGDYNADSIEVLEGLEPVRKRPGMYIGGTDAARTSSSWSPRCIDNSMDEAVAGLCQPHRGRAGRRHYKLTVTRQWPRHSGRSAPQVSQGQVGARRSSSDDAAFAGGKFEGKAYADFRRFARGRRVGGQCPLGLDDHRARWRATRTVYRTDASRKRPCHVEARSRTVGSDPQPARHQRHLPRRRSRDFRQGCQIQSQARLFTTSIRSKAYLFAGVEIRWKCAIPSWPVMMSRSSASSSSSKMASPTI